MSSLLLFRDITGNVHYVPTNRLLNVVRENGTECHIYTNIVTYDNFLSPQVVSYKLMESVGGGAGDTTQVQAIYDAWEKALQNKSALIEVFLPFAITTVTGDTLVWP